MARKSKQKSTGKLAYGLAIVSAIAGLLGAMFVAVALVQSLAGDAATVSRGWKIGFGLALVAAAIAGGTGWVLGGRIAQRIADVAAAVGKIGRGGSEVKVRGGGNDEIGALGRSVQYLANDLHELLKEQQAAGGAALVSLDPQVRQLRDKVLPQQLTPVAGHEVDGAMSGGSRGGLDYFDAVAMQGEEPGAVVYVVSAEGHGALSVFGCRLARDELHRALAAGALPRKALAHTNKVCKNLLPQGCCASATLLQVTAQGAKLYQAGARSPLLICQRGEVFELNAEGIALGLDDGPVFEKSLRPQEITMSPGTRLILGNDALHRTEGLLDLLREHSPRHTNMFMNVVLGGIEEDAGEDGLREDVVLITVKKAGQA